MKEKITRSSKLEEAFQSIISNNLLGPNLIKLLGTYLGA